MERPRGTKGAKRDQKRPKGANMGQEGPRGAKRGQGKPNGIKRNQITSKESKGIKSTIKKKLEALEWFRVFTVLKDCLNLDKISRDLEIP